MFYFTAKTRVLKPEALSNYIAMSGERLKGTEEDYLERKKITAAILYKKIIDSIDSKFGQRPMFIQNILRQLERDLFEDEHEFYIKWRSVFKQYLGLKAKKWKLDMNANGANSHEESLVCKICEKKFSVDKIVLHSKDCVDRAKEKEKLVDNHKKMLKLSEIAFEKKQELTVRATIKR